MSTCLLTRLGTDDCGAVMLIGAIPVTGVRTGEFLGARVMTVLDSWDYADEPVLAILGIVGLAQTTYRLTNL